MKKRLAILFILGFAAITACNNSAETKNNAVIKTKADTLLNEVDDNHMGAMGKMGRLNRTQQAIGRIIDSISKLPAKAQLAAAPYRIKLDSLLAQLNSANDNMEKWMHSFNRDTFANNLEERIQYFDREIIKSKKVKEEVLNSLGKADSVLKSKF